MYYYPDYYKAMKELEKSKNKVISLSQLIEPIRQGYPFKSRDFLESGSLGIIRIRNIGKDGGIRLQKMVYASQDVFDQHQDAEAKTGDIIIGMDGDEFRAAIIPPDFNGLINQRIAIIRTKKEINPKIIKEYINGAFGRIQLERKKTKTTAGHITLEDIKIPDFTTAQNDIVKVFDEELHEAENIGKKAKLMVVEARDKIQQMIMGNDKSES